MPGLMMEEVAMHLNRVGGNYIEVRLKLKKQVI